MFINKVVKGKVITDAPVLAGANPNNGNKKKWIRRKSPLHRADRIRLPNATTIHYDIDSRRYPDFERDKNISMAMTKGISKKTRSKDGQEDSELLDMIFIQKYLAIARTQTPRLQKRHKNTWLTITLQKGKKVKMTPTGSQIT